jgi:hypothetical protein
MAKFNQCRFCDDWRDQGLVKYGTRHYAHFRCYLDRGKALDALPAWRVSTFPYFLLKERGLLDEARRLAGNENPISGELLP